MKVLHILGSLNIGGAENLIANLLECAVMNNSSNEYSIVYMHPSNTNRVELFNKYAKVTLIECDKGIVKTLGFIKKLRKYIKANGIEIIHCHNNIDAYWAYLASIGTEVKKVVLTIHGFNLDFDFLGRKIKVLPQADELICKRIVKTYVSKATVKFYKEHYNNKTLSGDVIYNGVSFYPKNLSEDYILNKSEYIKNHPLKDLNWLKGGKPVFGMIGNFNTPVRLQILICKAIDNLKKRHKGELPFKFIFIGNNSNPVLFNKCVDFCKENDTIDKDIFFLGALDNAKELLPLLSGYVYCSTGDSFGLSTIEAIGAGLPTICSDIETFKEVLDNGKYAYLVNNTIKEIADAIDMLCNNIINKKEPLLDGVLNMAPFIVRDVYSMKRCLASYESKYRE